MDCKRASSYLADYAENDLPPLMRKQIDRHLEHCYPCMEELQDIVNLLDRTRQVLRHPHPVNQFAAVQAQIQILRKTRPDLRSHLTLGTALKTFVAAAAMILLVLSVSKTVASAAPNIDFDSIPASFQDVSSLPRPQANWPIMHRVQMEAALRDMTGIAPVPEQEPKASSKTPPSAQPVISSIFGFHVVCA